jgi:hypothetical protein
VWTLAEERHVSLGSYLSNLTGALAGFCLVRALATGEALDPAFSREHEPKQYWSIVGGLLLSTLFFIGSFVAAAGLFVREVL